MAKCFCITFGAILLLLMAIPAFACSDFLIQAEDNTAIVGRTMDFAAPIPADVVLHPRGEKWISPAPDGKDGKKWTAQYGYVGFSCLKMKQVTDGINEKGLSAGMLWLPSVGYQHVAPKDDAEGLGMAYVASYLLGTCATVEDVKAEMPKVRVWGMKIKEMGNTIPTLHITVHDASGKSLVIEWIDGALKMYDNPLGVMTNDPPFSSMLDIIRTYGNMSPYGKPFTIGGTTMTQPGFGSGLVGMPGDPTPPSRLIRLTLQKKFAYTPKNAAEGIILARHLLNVVDIAPGVGRSKENGEEVSDYTQWSTIKDLTNRKLYFSTYEDQCLRMIDLNKLDFSQSSDKFIDMMKPSGADIKEITNQLQ